MSKYRDELVQLVVDLSEQLDHFRKHGDTQYVDAVLEHRRSIERFLAYLDARADLINELNEIDSSVQLLHDRYIADLTRM